jgi:hypothetical protein
MEQGDRDAATIIFNNSVIQSLRRHDLDRYQKLAHLIDRTSYAESNEMYGSSSTKEDRRKKVAEGKEGV